MHLSICLLQIRMNYASSIEPIIALGFRLRKMGALEVNKVVHGDQLWRLVTCNWLHAGVFHLLANMLSLLVIGIRLEQEFGFSMYLLSFSLFLFWCW